MTFKIRHIIRMVPSITLAIIPAILLGAILLISTSSASLAQTIIRDREIEKTFSTWFSPVIEAAELNEEAINVILVQDNQINAFVAGGPNVFFYTGLLLETDDPGEIIGVFAHELGHIRGGHLIRGRMAMERASYETLIGTILGLGAAIASGEGEAAGAIAAGSQSQALRRFLSHSRVQESSADQAALKYLNRAGMSPEGLISFFRKLQEKHGLVTGEGAEYTRTHPLTANRIAALENEAKKSPYFGRNWPPQWQEDYDRMQAKLLGFLQPGHVIWTYSESDTSIAAEYARAIADYRQGNTKESLSRLAELIGREPENPYFYELKGQVLVDDGRVSQALDPYRKAVSLDPKAGLIRIALAHALIESAGHSPENPAMNDSPENAANNTGTGSGPLDEAITHLKEAARYETQIGRAHV